MGIRKIMTVEEPCLHKVCRPVEKFDGKLHKLLDDMKETLLDANGVGLAAPQVGILRRVVVIDLGDEMLELVAQQLLDRFEIQANKFVYNFPFLMGQGVWIDSDKLDWNDEVREVLKHGTLSVGFIGLAECLKCLIGEHQGESERAQNLGNHRGHDELPPKARGARQIQARRPFNDGEKRAEQ